MDSVFCMANPNQSYALFLPREYDENRSWPIIYFFEPLARGSLPVKKYQELANEFGFIFCGSNNSRNGPLAENEKAFTALRKDTEARFNLDSSSIYVCGFSGGGRFSQYIASKYEEIDGVIAVAGAKSTYSANYPLVGDDLLYVGVVGTQDMNYLEHRHYENELVDKNITSHTVLYMGDHRWPPVPVFDQALFWLDAVRKEALHPQYIDHQLSAIDSIKGVDVLEAHRLWSSLIRNFSIGEDQYRGLGDFFQGHKTLSKRKAGEAKEFDYEQKERVRLMEALVHSSDYFTYTALVDSLTYDLVWWEKEITSIQNRSKRKGRWGRVYARLLDQMRGVLYGYSNRAESQNNTQLSLFVNDLYLLLYPESVYLHWYRATLLAKQGDQGKSLKHLKKAGKLNSSLLQNFRSQKKWLGLRDAYPFLFTPLP